jgi:UDP-GlcNAc:undecaprenyl-phosphate GlcNAc-1-phosphate transferase
MSLIFSSLLGGVLINLALTPFAIHLCQKYGFMDRPGHRKIHDVPIPKLGGAALVLAVLLVQAIYFIYFGFCSTLHTHGEITKLLFILGSTSLFALIGFLDDIYDLKPSFKILIQLFITGCFTYFGYRFEVLQIPGFSPLGLGYLGIPFTALWMMAVINGFNFMDGVDGLAGSVSLFCLLGLGVISTYTNEPLLSVLIFSALGAIIVFLIFNWRPAKIYLGNCGSNLLGALVASFLVSYKNDLLWTDSNPLASPQPFLFQITICTLLVGYPLLEAALSTFRRGVKRLLFNRSMEWSEKEHIHHRLLKLGFRTSAICWSGILLQLIFASAALLALLQQKALAVWLLIPFFMIMAYIMPRMGFFDFLNIEVIRTQKPHYLILHHFILMQRIKLGLMVGREEILALLNQTCAELGVQYFQIKVNDKRVKGGHFSYSWERPKDVVREYLDYIKTERVKSKYDHFEDKIILDGNQGEADWIFEPHTEETELDVECRVLVSEFMKMVLERICSLKSSYSAKNKIIKINQLSHAKVRSSVLRRKVAKKSGHR